MTAAPVPSPDEVRKGQRPRIPAPPVRPDPGPPVPRPPEMDLAQRLAVQKVLSEQLAALRKDELDPEARAVLDPGERRAAKFGGQRAAWVGMPRPSRRATVTDPGKLLAWVRENAPHAVQVVQEAIVSPALLDYLAGHAPQFLRETERVDPQWTEDTLKGLKDRGRIADRNGEIHTEIPGITAGESEPVPRVTLEPDAALIIGKAWRSGAISIPALLALPEGGDPSDG